METMALTTEVTEGKISTNMKELETSIRQISDSYTVVTYEGDREDRLKMMKEDRASLNKLSTQIDSKRKQIKKEFIAPLEEFESQMKNLIVLINQPKDMIDQQAKAIEEEMKTEKRNAIRAYYDSVSSDLEAEWREQFYTRIYDKRWENTTTSKKTYVTAIDTAIASYRDGVSTVQMLESDFEEEGLKTLKETLDVTKAVAAVKDAEKRRDELLAKERARMEEERRRAEEAKRRAEEAARLAEERAAREAEERTKAEERAKAEAEARAKAEEIARKEAEERAKAEAAVKNSAAATMTPAATTSSGAGTVTVAFNSFDWNMLKTYCDENYIGYTVQ